MTDNRTTELREKLTERGVEYTTNDHMGAYETSWNGFTAMQLTPGAKLLMMFTPDQAIAATLNSEFNPDGLPAGLTISDDDTLLNWRGENYVKQSALGNGTLTAEQVREAIEKRFDFDVWVPAERWQAIADELSAELGSGTCTMRLLWCDYEDGECYECSSCEGMTYTHGWEPNYCENCGAKAVKR